MISARSQKELFSADGYTMIELLVVVIIVAILAAVAMRSLKSTNTTARVEVTKHQLERIAYAIAGDPSVVAEGCRTSYGYVGDVGALPPNLDALVSNPGSYTTWKGPYIVDEVTPNSSNARFKLDGWGNALTYSAGVVVSSTGGGSSSITRSIAPTSNALLRNQIAVSITDMNDNAPGTTYRDSVKALLDVPNGSGSVVTKVKYPSTDGFLKFDSIPIGQMLLRVVYIPNNDTLRKQVHVDPNSVVPVDVQLFRKVW